MGVRSKFSGTTDQDGGCPRLGDNALLVTATTGTRAPMSKASPIDAEFARRFADTWMDAWNWGEAERLLRRCAEDVIVQSPRISASDGGAPGLLLGKAMVRRYWERVMKDDPSSFPVEVVDVLVGVGCLTLYLRINEKLRAETFFFNSENLIVRLVVTYSLV